MTLQRSRPGVQKHLTTLYMEVLVSYDVATDTAAGRRRLRRVAQICLGYGQRVQKSVFECSINEMQYEQLRDRLLKCIDTEEDNLRIYRLIGAREQHVEAYGVSRYVDFVTTQPPCF